MKLEVINEDYLFEMDDMPNNCPFCHKTIMPTPLSVYLNREEDEYEVQMVCPNQLCQKTFIAYYSGTYCLNTIIGRGKTMEFNSSINELSPSFIQIYNEAYMAEQHQLMEICGVGYRKALEFLIKDYVISKHQTEEENIKKLFLGNCISAYVTDERVKLVATRAVWLGNDETHYVRKWEDKDLTDLKKLIDLTVHWIEMEVLTESFENDMPQGRRS